jgi:hypothetical protein
LVFISPFSNLKAQLAVSMAPSLKTLQCEEGAVTITRCTALDSLQGHHKAAIALNNTAVSLLVRGYSRHALEIFNDAMKVMRMVTVHNEEQQPDSTTSTTSDIEGSGEEVRLALDRASMRSARCISPCRSRNMPLLQVVSTHCNSSTIYEGLASCAQCVSFPVAFPMTIDPIDYEACAGDDVGLHAAVVLYNYGIAHDCIAATTVWSTDKSPTVPSNDGARLQHTIQNKALRIYQLTMAVLSKVHADGDSPSYMGSQSLLLQAFLTHNLIQVSIKLNLQFEYHEYCVAMERLVQLLDIQQLLLPAANGALAAAA